MERVGQLRDRMLVSSQKKKKKKRETVRRQQPEVDGSKGLFKDFLNKRKDSNMESA